MYICSIKYHSITDSLFYRADALAKKPLHLKLPMNADTKANWGATSVNFCFFLGEKVQYFYPHYNIIFRAR